jgi:Ketopantoate hydroxymethyltransferase
MYTQLQLRDSTRPPVNVASLARMKEQGEKISCITCYDASYAALVDAADIDVVLVGDSLGMVIQGHDTTVPVTLDHIIYHCRAVAKGLFRPFLMADMPFMTYTSKETALANAVRVMQEGGAKMVKLEGGAGQADTLGCGRSRSTRLAGFACRVAKKPRPSRCVEMPSCCRMRAPTSCCSSACLRTSARKSRPSCTCR